MKFDLTITIVAIVTLCSVLSPVLTSIISNRYSMKMKVMDIEQEKSKEIMYYKRGVFEEYLSQTCAAIQVSNDSEFSRSSYAKVYPLALAYSPDNLRPDLIKLNDYIIHIKFGSNFTDAVTLLDELIPKIRQVIDSF